MNKVQQSKFYFKFIVRNLSKIYLMYFPIEPKLHFSINSTTIIIINDTHKF